MDDTARDLERELADRARQGDREAFDELVRLCARRLYGLLYRLTWNQEEAAELTQRTLVKAYLALDKFRGEASFYTWLHRIAVNTCRNYKRDQARRREVPLEDGRDFSRAPSNQFAQVENREESAMLWAAAEDLPARQKEALVLRIKGEHTFAEVARIMGCSVGAAKAHYFQAVRKLRLALEDKGI